MAVWECLTFRQWSTSNVLCAFRNMLNVMLAPGSKYSPFFLKDHGGKFLLHCNFNVAELPSCLPNFFRECFEVWCNLSVKPVLSREQALNQLLWNNQFLRIDGKPIFNKKLFSKGLISLPDVLTNTGSLKSWTFFKAEGLNLNDYLLLYGLFDSRPLTWKKLINSKGGADTSADSAQLHSLLKDDTLPFDSITSSKLYWKLIEIRSILQHWINLVLCFRIMVILIAKWSIKFLILLLLTLKQEFFGTV